MPTVAFISPSFDLRPLALRLAADNPKIRPVLWPSEDIAGAEVAVCWAPPPGIYAEMPGLKLIHGVAAGADNLLSGQDLRGIPVCRVVDPGQAQGMLEYVTWAVLYFHRNFDIAERQQPTRRWHREPSLPARQWRVGVLGLGAIGARTAAGLASLGYDVAGWARAAHDIPGVQVFRGRSSLPAFLARTDTLVCLLPLTDETRGLLDKDLFDALPRGASLVHVGRGPHLAEADLLDVLRTGQLRGAVIDVFEREPLSDDHPFWREAGIRVTPHMATMADAQEVQAQILENIRRLEAGQPLLNSVNTSRGY